MTAPSTRLRTALWALCLLALVAIVAWPASTDGIASVVSGDRTASVTPAADGAEGPHIDRAVDQGSVPSIATTQTEPIRDAKIAHGSGFEVIRVQHRHRLTRVLALVALLFALVAWAADRRFLRPRASAASPPPTRLRAPDPCRGPPAAPSTCAPCHPARRTAVVPRDRCSEVPHVRPCTRGRRGRATCARLDRSARHRDPALAGS